MNNGKLVLLLIALNPFVFGGIVGIFLRHKRLPPPHLRLFATFTYFIVSYLLLWLLLEVVDIKPLLPTDAP